MSNVFPPKNVIAFALLLMVVLVGCSHQKTQRGHLFRADWAFEYNRTPWIGCPPDSGYSEVKEKKTGIPGLFSCLAKDKDSDSKNRKRFRHHCAQNAECVPQNPCCRTLGCGMWIDPEDPATFATLGGPAKACGLLPFCTPQKPCCLTPNCGRPTAVNINPQTLMLSSHNANTLGAGMSGRSVQQETVPGNAFGNAAAMQNGMGTVRGMSPTRIVPNGMGLTGMLPGGAIGATSGAALVSRGIVPGASAITSGGMVAAIGVATPTGTMTPAGVRFPNGNVNNAIVLRACMITQNCSAARPCGLTPNCGGAVAVNMVANNATVLASALQAQGVAGGVMHAGGTGVLVNPITNQPVPGLTMGGYPQAGYPPIGYAPSGYAPGYPRFAAGMVDTGEAVEEEQQHDKEVVPPYETRSNMPVPRFHPIPIQPTFQRSEGMPPTPRTAPKTTPTAMTSRQELSERELEAALDQAYLEGVSAAMDEVERKLEVKRQAVVKAKLEEKILLQAEYVQQQLDAQNEMRMLAIQRERQLQQQALRQQAMAVAVSEPQRLPPTNGGTATPYQQPISANVKPVQLAENLKTSVVNGVNGIFSPLLGANQTNHQFQQRGQVSTQPRYHSAPPKSQPQLAAIQSDLPDKPPVSPIAPNYGLSDDESESSILQARFSDDGEVIRP